MSKESPKNWKKKYKTHKNNHQNSENKIFEKSGTYVEEDTLGYLFTKCERFILIYESMIANNGFDLLLAVN